MIIIIAKAIHRELSGKYGFQRNERYYDHVPDNVLENEDYITMLRDFIIWTDHEIKVWRSDLLVIDKTENNCQIIDVAIPDDGRVGAKEEEKVEKYHLEREIRKMWGIRTKAIPIVLGALGTIPLRLKENLRTISVNTSIELIQRCALLGSARILRKVLEM